MGGIYIDAGLTLTLSGIVTNAPEAHLTKLGEGTLIFAGNQTFTGATHVDNTTLSGNVNTAGESINFNGSTFYFAQAVVGTYTGTIIGNGNLNVSGEPP